MKISTRLARSATFMACALAMAATAQADVCYYPYVSCRPSGHAYVFGLEASGQVADSTAEQTWIRAASVAEGQALGFRLATADEVRTLFWNRTRSSSITTAHATGPVGDYKIRTYSAELPPRGRSTDFRYMEGPSLLDTLKGTATPTCVAINTSDAATVPGSCLTSAIVVWAADGAGGLTAVQLTSEVGDFTFPGGLNYPTSKSHTEYEGGTVGADTSVPASGYLMVRSGLPPLTLTATPSTVVISPSWDASYTSVALNRPPAGNVPITATRSSGSSDITGGSVTLTPDDWTGRGLRFQGPLYPPQDLSAVFTIAAPGVTGTTVTVTEAAREAPVILLDRNSVVLPVNGDAAAPVMVRLSAPPASLTRIDGTLTSGDAELANNFSLNFTTGDWNVAQPVYLRGVANPTRSLSGTYTLTSAGLAPVTIQATQTYDPPACSVAYRVVKSWKSGFQAEVILANLTATSASGWNVSWTYNARTSILLPLGAVISTSNGGTAVSANPTLFNRRVAGNGAVKFGFYGSKGSTVPAVDRLSATLGGKSCSVVTP